MGSAAARPAKWLVFLLLLLPAGRWIFLGVQGGLGPNPAEFLIRSSGIWALVVLWLTLAITPLRRLAGWHGLVRYRRLCGLFSFAYTVLHAIAWAVWDRGGQWAAMWTDILQRDFIQVGWLAVLCLLPLALTSTNASIRRLGRNWRRLHWLIHPAAILSVWHFWLMRAGKNDFAEPWTYAAILAVLLGLRLWWWLQPAR